MSIVYFGNEGEFDVRAMLTFGVSVKDNVNAIGYFGTGLKYAIAVVLRLGGTITIISNGHTYGFTKETKAVRGKLFDFVCVNGIEAGFTTHLGSTWEPWMAYRELYCNCKDEGGVISTKISEHATLVVVDCPEVWKAHEGRHAYLLEGEPDVVSEDVEIHYKPSQYVFYRGIAVHRLEHSAILTYNIKTSVELTEDRTAKREHMLHYYIKRGLQGSTDDRLIYRVLSAPQESYEQGIGYDADYPVSDEFIASAKKLRAAGRPLSDSVIKVLVQKKSELCEYDEIGLSELRAKMMYRATQFLLGIDIDINKFPIKLVQGLGDGVMGRAYEGVIYLSELAFNMGTKQLASTLIEEYIHLEHRVEDFDRRMQDWLFNKILSLGEEIQVMHGATPL